tara:strand:+ start:966 stop:1157 length:192 start_codon:yes stop_codon:yes gene_type:complete
MKTTQKFYLKNGMPWSTYMHKMPNGIIYTNATHRRDSQPLFYLKDLSRASQRIALKLGKKHYG